MGSRWLPFGSLGRPHGTKGEILLFPFNTAGAGLNESDLPLRVRVVKAEKSVEANIVAFRPVHRGFLVRFADAESRESVGAMVGAQVTCRVRCSSHSRKTSSMWMTSLAVRHSLPTGKGWDE